MEKRMVWIKNTHLTANAGYYNRDMNVKRTLIAGQAVMVPFEELQVALAADPSIRTLFEEGPLFIVEPEVREELMIGQNQIIEEMNYPTLVKFVQESDMDLFQTALEVATKASLENMVTVMLNENGVSHDKIYALDKACPDLNVLGQLQIRQQEQAEAQNDN